MTDTRQLPRRWANQLLHHLATCPDCIAAKAARAPGKCPHRRELVRLTLEERHGG